MFKYNFLRYHTNSALKKNKSLRASLPYQQARNIGIIFTVEDKQKHDRIKDLVQKFKIDGKAVSVLEFLPVKKENYEFLFDFFSAKDLSFWGKITSEAAIQFAKNDFDYIYYLDTKPNPLILNLLAVCKGRCRVGPFNETDSPFFELMIAHNGPVTGLIDSMYTYTKQLK